MNKIIIIANPLDEKWITAWKDSFEEYNKRANTVKLKGKKLKDFINKPILVK